MSYLRLSSPHTHGPNRTSRVMQWVMLAALPGLTVQVAFFGWGNLINVIFCMAMAVATEALVLKLRRRPLGFYLKDCSAMVTGLLLGLALPPLLPWWISLVAVVVAIVFAKQLYGGLGSNPFNPAMVGYALVLVSFPVAMTTNWVEPGLAWSQHPGLLDTLQQIFAGGITAPDAWTQATPLDVYKHHISAETAQQVLQHPAFGQWVAYGWEWVNLAFLAGGLLLIKLRIITWHIPVAMLGALAVCSLAFGWDPDQYVPVQMHLLAGGTMLGAFFIATDPVSAATSNQGKLYYGAGIGILIYVIRSWGGYPDAVAFAVLLMNFAAPFIDYYARPRTYGHVRPRRGIGK
ncbi:electron transport complex subunit RsxD [Marinobacteraceae bacterium S3BR75-40.1]